MKIELLHHLMDGSVTAEERRQLMEWFRQCTSKEEFFRLFDTAWKDSPDEMPRDVQERMYHRLRRKLDEEAEKKKKTARHYTRRKIWAWATAACVILALSLTNYQMSNRQKQLATQHFVVSAAKGQRAFITLPDSTKVWLNSETRLSYPADYGLKERNVTLLGEAYFEVARHPDKPFVVRAKDMRVEALGTKFNILAYRDADKMVTSLFSGSVRVSYDDYMTVLKPHESVEVDLPTHGFTRYTDRNMRETALWREGEITFDGEPLEEITRIISRLYNITICIEDESLKGIDYVGTIRNNSLENFLDIINLTTPINYEHKGDTVFLKRKVPSQDR